MLAAPFTCDALEQIAVGDSMPSYTAGIFTRVDPPLARAAAAMAKAITVAARHLDRPS